MNEYDKFEIAKWFLRRESMTPKKLQKIMYYAYAWGLVFFNDSENSLENHLFNANFEAWVHGPVDRSLYAHYADYGYHNIEKPKNKIIINNEDILDLLQQTMDAYGSFTGNQLERLTHQEEPWIRARGNAKPLDSVRTIISDKDIYVYYGLQMK